MAQPRRQPLGPGDKVPNFHLPDVEGTHRQFQGETDGRPILLVVARTLADADGAEAAKGLALQQQALAGAGVQVLVVAKDDRATLAKTVADHGLQVLVFPDDNSGLADFLLSAAGDAAPLAFYLLDANQRILKVLHEGAPASLAETALAFFQGWSEAREEGLTLSRGAPVLALPRVFTPEFCDKLIGLWREEHHEGGVSDASRNIQDESKKKTLEHVIQDQALNQEIARTISRRVGLELQKAFMANEPYAFESFIVMRYGPERQDFFGMHRDRYLPDHPRRFAVSLNLNDGFEGGELRFPEYGPHLYRPPKGGAAVFSCSLLHEALPVRAGERFVMTAFFNVAKQKAA